MKTTLHIYPSKHIHELQEEFSAAYPFLRLDFYLTPQMKSGQPMLVKKPITTSSSLKAAGLKKQGDIDISDTVTVSSLEKSLKDRFGMIAQVLRKSDNIWLETTMTDDWTLFRQNEHGREITHGVTQEKEGPADYDLERNNS